MKKNCNGCRASDRGHYGEYICHLGHAVQSVSSANAGFYKEGKPLEECPKPKTYDKYLELAYGGKR
jgi:hypothetical protein